MKVRYDKETDSLTIIFTNEKIEESDEDLWQGKIRNDKGVIVREISWKSIPENIFWDGKDDFGNILSDGKYSFEIFSEDRGGNLSKKTVDNIVIDNRGVSAIVSVSNNGFSPNNDNYFDNLEFSLYAAPLNGIESWELSVIDNSGNMVKSFSGSE